MKNPLSIFMPRFLFRDVTHITPAFLKKRGIKALVVDVDNTLTAHGSQQLDDDIAAWLEKMKAAGIQLMLASNNVKKRVAPFAEKLGVEYASFCCKPSPLWLLQANKRWGLERGEMAVVGDQIFTDLLAGHLAGVRVLLVRPLTDDPKASIRLKRRLEKPFLLKYYRSGGRLR